jgi:hypothetical protein
MISYGYGRDSIALWVLQAERPISADKSQVCTSALQPDSAAVYAFHTAALASGGRDNGAPRLRPIYGPGY